MKSIKLKGVRTNNLKNIDVEFPINKISCVSGVSGSGKSSLVFHTLANESKRRFLNSLPSSMNFFERVPASADLDSIEPVLPVWTLAQSNPIVGSRLNIADQLELTYSLAQLYYCDDLNTCQIHELKLTDVYKSIENEISQLALEDSCVLHFFVNSDLYSENLNGSPIRSYNTASAEVRDFDSEDELWEVFRLKFKSIKNFKKKWTELFSNSDVKQFSVLISSTNELKYFSLLRERECPKCLESGLSSARLIGDLLPSNGVGACVTCNGYGSTLEYDIGKIVKYPKKTLMDGAITFLEYSKYCDYYHDYIREIRKIGLSEEMTFSELPKEATDILMNGRGRFYGVLNFLSDLELKRYKRSARIFLRSLQSENTCKDCDGTRISKSAILHKSKFSNLPIYGELLKLTISDIHKLLIKLKNKNTLKILNTLNIAIDIGLGSFSLSTKLKSLETSEYQKSLLVRYLSYQGSGSLFVMDEPSLGLNTHEQDVLLKYLKVLSTNNTVVLVDHSDILRSGSHNNIQIGPGAGHLGGEVVKYVPNKIDVRNIDYKFTKSKNKLVFKGIDYENKTFKNITFKIGEVNQITCEMESFGKRLIIDVLCNALNEKLFNEKKNFESRYSIEDISFNDDIEDVLIYQTKIEKSSSRSSVGTTLDLINGVRTYFSRLPVSKSLGLEKGHFSKNSKLGQCTSCEGRGIQEVDMQFLEDVKFACEDCGGDGIKPFYSTITDGKYTITDATNTPLSELYENLPLTAKGRRTLEYLKLLNLDYLTLERTIPSLSGGERLRIKLLKAIDKKVANSVIVLTNISYGLSNKELASIVELLSELTKSKNTILLLDNHMVFSKFNKIEI